MNPNIIVVKRITLLVKLVIWLYGVIFTEVLKQISNEVMNECFNLLTSEFLASTPKQNSKEKQIVSIVISSGMKQKTAIQVVEENSIKQMDGNWQY